MRYKYNIPFIYWDNIRKEISYYFPSMKHLKILYLKEIILFIERNIEQKTLTGEMVGL